MKKLFSLIVILFIATVSFGQQNETVTVNTKDLPPEVLEQIKQKQKQQEVTSTLKTYGEWAGIGKEVGVAVKEGLTAVKDVAVDFSKTDVGTFTMVLIAWKVVGKDIMGLFVGLLVFVVGFVLIVWSYRKTCVTRRVCIKSAGVFREKQYDLVKPHTDLNVGFAIFVHAVALFGLIGIVCAIIFG